MFYGRGAGTAPTASAVCGDVLDIVRCPRKRGERPDGAVLPALPSFTRQLRLFERVRTARTPESEAQVLAAFPGARLVQIEGEAFADEFALVTALGQEDALLDAAEQLAQALPCGAADPLPDAVRRRPIVPHAGSGTARPCAGDGGEGGLRSPLALPPGAPGRSGGGRGRGAFSPKCGAKRGMEKTPKNLQKRC